MARHPVYKASGVQHVVFDWNGTLIDDFALSALAQILAHLEA